MEFGIWIRFDLIKDQIQLYSHLIYSCRYNASYKFVRAGREHVLLQSECLLILSIQGCSNAVALIAYRIAKNL